MGIDVAEAPGDENTNLSFSSGRGGVGGGGGSQSPIVQSPTGDHFPIRSPTPTKHQGVDAPTLADSTSGDAEDAVDLAFVGGGRDSVKNERGVTAALGGKFNARNLRHRSNRHTIAVRMRQRRQTMQDMARPLKHWLYRHRNNPYPTKAQKVQLALHSQMTLTQVSNWFANARRRLKNTVRESGISWGRRIKMYNSYVVGNAELLSVSSDDSTWDMEDDQDSLWDTDAADATEVGQMEASDVQTEVGQQQSQSGQMQSIHQQQKSDWFKTDQSQLTSGAGTTYQPIGATPPSKEFHDHHPCNKSILVRYLHDAYEHSLELQDRSDCRKRNASGSLSSHDYERMSSSSKSSPGLEEQRAAWDNDSPPELLKCPPNSVMGNLSWEEISAAMALTTLARSRHNSAQTY